MSHHQTHPQRQRRQRRRPAAPAAPPPPPPSLRAGRGGRRPGLHWKRGAVAAAAARRAPPPPALGRPLPQPAAVHRKEPQPAPLGEARAAREKPRGGKPRAHPAPIRQPALRHDPHRWASAPPPPARAPAQASSQCPSPPARRRCRSRRLHAVEGQLGLQGAEECRERWEAHHGPPPRPASGVH